MPVLDPPFLMDLESRMRHIQEDDYANISAGQNLWWDQTTRVLQSGGRKEIVTWVLNTAELESNGKGGNIAFDEMTILETEFEVEGAAKGLRIQRPQFEDLDGNGVNIALAWSSQMGGQYAYWPQKQSAIALKNGHLATSIAYDGRPFFDTAHPVNPTRPAYGTYSNLFTGADAAPIDNSVTADVAFANLQKVFAKICSIKMPNGTDPRFLEPSAILCSPALFPRAVQITNAKFLAQAAASGGGSGDVESVISALGYGKPTLARELAGYENDTTYFVVAKQIANTQLGGLVYVEREKFTTRYYTGRGGGNGVDAILDRADILEWHASGRNIMGYGHPFVIFKVKAT